MGAVLFRRRQSTGGKTAAHSERIAASCPIAAPGEAAAPGSIDGNRARGRAGSLGFVLRRFDGAHRLQFVFVHAELRHVVAAVACEPASRQPIALVVRLDPGAEAGFCPCCFSAVCRVAEDLLLAALAADSEEEALAVLAVVVLAAAEQAEVFNLWLIYYKLQVKNITVFTL